MSRRDFPRKLRLLTAADFSFVFQLPRRVSTPQLTLLARENQLGYPRLGLAIAKKQLKQAHQRNRYKRLLRESFRHHHDTLPAMDFLAIAKKGIECLDNRVFMAMLDKLWQRYAPQIQSSQNQNAKVQLTATQSSHNQSFQNQ